MPQSTQITETSPLLHDANCVYCHVDLELGDQVAVCDVCQSPHHADCWGENGNKCATFGCVNSEVAVEETPPPFVSSFVSFCTVIVSVLVGSITEKLFGRKWPPDRRSAADAIAFVIWAAIPTFFLYVEGSLGSVGIATIWFFLITPIIVAVFTYTMYRLQLIPMRSRHVLWQSMIHTIAFDLLFCTLLYNLFLESSDGDLLVLVFYISFFPIWVFSRFVLNWYSERRERFRSS